MLVKKKMHPYTEMTIFYPADRQIDKKASAFNDAPPTSAPDTPSIASISCAFSAFTDPPYRIGAPARGKLPPNKEAILAVSP
jgi:hypothetical protein